MGITDVAIEYFALEARIASFQSAQPLVKRTSSAHSKVPKSLKWPHKFLSGEEMANAGFFFYPTQANPDNVACFLCHSSLDGWQKGDDPLAEHLTHSPECGWAIVASINAHDKVFSKMNPASSTMIAARRATFANQWPHENKKGWKCKAKQMAEAGWKFTPTLEYDDMTTCTYCDLGLDGWEPSDRPWEEHFARSPECQFFTHIEHEPNPVELITKGKKGRPSKASRASRQSVMTTNSDAPSVMDMPAEEDDSILTTATTATSKGRKGTKGKKAAVAKGRKTKAKKEESVEAMPEAEDEKLEVDAEPTPPRANRGKKRKSLEMHDVEPPAEVEAPQRKRRNTRTRGSTAANEPTLEETIAETKPPAKKGRGTVRKSSRKASTASVVSAASINEEIPNDEEIDKALLADLERPSSDDEETGVEAPLRRPTRASKSAKTSHEMFGTSSIEIDEAAIEAELEAIETAARPLPPLPKNKANKSARPRKASARQEAAAKKAAEAEAAAAAQRIADEEDAASQQISNELEHSISDVHPVVELNGRPAEPSQDSQQPRARGTRVSILSDGSNISTHDVSSGTVIQTQNEPQDEVDESHLTVNGGETQESSTPATKSAKHEVIIDPEETEDELEILPVEEDTSSVVAVPDELVEASKPSEIYAEVEEEMVEEVQAMTPLEASSPQGQPAKLVEHETMQVNEDYEMTTDTNKVERVQEPSPLKAPRSRGRPSKRVEEEATEIIEDSTMYKDTKVLERLLEKTPVKAPRSRGRPPKVAAAETSLDVIPNAPSPSPARTRTPILPRPKTTKIPTPRAPSPSPPPKEATPADSPQSSDAENHPPSSKPSATAKKATFATPGRSTKAPLVASTPQTSPTRRNVIAGLQSEEPWTAVDLDLVFLKSPENEHGQSRGLLDEALEKARTGDLSSPEKKMSVEEWIQYNASSAESKFREDCERMVGTFESEGGRAMRVLESVVVEDE
ncbi:AT hook domain-containing protein [Phlyctema vagabunda]|uniref:AT hook domain-containing protein n=1 Tax=Phlyctema vagabunda TaxID=108571 RepID=A0ABR4PWE4_9HELO